MQRNTGYFPTESLEPCGNRLFSRSALNEGYLFRGSLDVRVLESLDAAGCTTWQKIRYGILPQLMPNFASTAIYRFDINLRDATVLGLVGAGGIGAPLIFAMNSYRWSEAGAILAGLIVLVLAVEWLSTKIRIKLARG